MNAETTCPLMFFLKILFSGILESNQVMTKAFPNGVKTAPEGAGTVPRVDGRGTIKNTANLD